MELLEYQAKELFRTVGIPVLPSLTLQNARKIKQLQIPYPVVLKSQVRSGGRGKAGGIRFVANTIDAIAAARIIFNLPIIGEYPEVILAEAHYNAEREIFLAIVLDYDLQCPVLLGSARGGMNINSLLDNLQQVAVRDRFSLFYARRLAAKMELSGQLICSVSNIIAKMYRLFEERDLDLIEINPLGVNTKGELMALDGRITINDNALMRQPIIANLNFSAQQRVSIESSTWTTERDFSQVRKRWLDWNDKSGQVAIICSSFDSALLTWDLLQQQKVVPACAALIENSLESKTDKLALYREKLLDILQEIESVEDIKAILLNIWDAEDVSLEVVQTINSYCQKSIVTPAEGVLVNSAIATGNVAKENNDEGSASIPNLADETRPRFILRLLDRHNVEQLDELSLSPQIYLSSSLEESIEKTISVVKSS